MAYMDVAATGKPNGKIALLLHGKNFFGAYWEKTIRFLAEQGFRVIVPDQLGFGKSSKPDIHYSFQLLAHNTQLLLDRLGIRTVDVIGHSMGGMLATRFALMYPARTAHLILENPIGLEDYKLFVPYATVEENYQEELKRTQESIRIYHKSYYAEWKEEYDLYAQVQYRMMLGGEFHRFARAAALTSDMIYTQPVVYEFPRLKVPTLLVIGQADRTAIGKDKVLADVKKQMGQYPSLGKKTAAAIPGAQLVEIEKSGHIPHLEATEQFHTVIARFLNN